MTRLAWDNVGERIFETGVDRGVLYIPTEPAGIPWNGLTAVNETASGGDSSPLYLDGQKFYNRSTPEEFEASIEAYTYPEEFGVCDGTATLDELDFTQQPRHPFNFSYRTRIGNDVDGVDFAYKIHIVYNALAKPSGANYKTLGSSTDAVVFNWSITTTPVDVPGLRPTAHVVISSKRISANTMATIEDYLYGSTLVNSGLLLPSDLLEIMPWLYFEIVPNETTGINTLIVSETLDVRGDPAEGIYRRTPRSRLKESTTSGFYTLEI